MLQPRFAILATVVLGIAAGAVVFAISRGWTIAADLGPIAVHSSPPPENAPDGMAWIPGGVFWMGSDEFPDARPIHKAAVDGFWMDKTEVTNAQFRRFIDETKYVTVAERAPDFDEIVKQLPPGSPPPLKEDLVPGSLVFTPPVVKVPLENPSQWWRWVPGANWRHPEGPKSDLKVRDDLPVVHIAFADAQSYCQWKSKKLGGAFRLPTEAEWEFAARGGLDRKPFVWGDTATPGGKSMANHWQGDFPSHNSKADGFAGLAPVASFPANGFGLFDMAGNVWEWCGDWYRPGYDKSAATKNPRGPASSLDPAEPTVPKRVQRGGSFLCADSYCKRYMPGGRGKCDPDSSTNHIGFRTIREP